MNGRVSFLVACALAVGCMLGASAARVQAQSFSGKWVQRDPKGASVLEFFPGDKHVIGPMRGKFHHSTLLADGRVLQGDGSYVFRFVSPNRGWLTLHFPDGHVTREHEHTLGATVLRLRHHGLVRTYVRE